MLSSDADACLSVRIIHVSRVVLSGRRDSNPRPSAWKAEALPIELLPLVAKSNYRILFRMFSACSYSHDSSSESIAHAGFDARLASGVGRGGFEPPKSETPDLQSGAFGRFATDPKCLVRQCFVRREKCCALFRMDVIAGALRKVPMRRRNSNEEANADIYSVLILIAP